MSMCFLVTGWLRDTTGSYMTSFIMAACQVGLAFSLFSLSHFCGENELKKAARWRQCYNTIQLLDSTIASDFPSYVFVDILRWWLIWQISPYSISQTNLVHFWIHVWIYSCDQPVLSNEVNIFSLSMKQRRLCLFTVL